MRALKTVGRLAAGIMIGVGALHVLVGFRSAPLLGISLPDAVLANPVLDSQDRFYGAMLLGLGVLLVYGLRDVATFRGVLAIVAWTVLVGGLARIASIFAVGWPTPLVTLFIVVELVLAGIFLSLLARVSAA